MAARLRLGGGRRTAGADAKTAPTAGRFLIRLAAAASASFLLQTLSHHERVLRHPAIQRRQRRRLLHRHHFPEDAERQLRGRVRRHGRSGRGASPNVPRHVRAAAAHGPSAAGARFGRRHRPQFARPGRIPALRTALGQPGRRQHFSGLDARPAAGRLHVLRVHWTGAAAVGDDRRGLPGRRPRRWQWVDVLFGIFGFLRCRQIGPGHVCVHWQRWNFFRVWTGGRRRRRFSVLFLSRDQEPDAAGD